MKCKRMVCGLKLLLQSHCVSNVASVGWSCFHHLKVFLHWPFWSTTEAHKSAFKLCSFERKCHPHTKTLASGGDLGVGLWQLGGSPWEPARFNHRARETHSGSCCMEWRRLLGLVTEQMNRLCRTFSDKSRNWNYIIFFIYLWKCKWISNVELIIVMLGCGLLPWCCHGIAKVFCTIKKAIIFYFHIYPELFWILKKNTHTLDQQCCAKCCSNYTEKKNV